jgi:hypothetical protein
MQSITFEFAAGGSNDSSNFYINGSTLLTSVTFDYENKNTYFINVVAKDDGKPSLNQTKQFKIKVGMVFFFRKIICRTSV